VIPTSPKPSKSILAGSGTSIGITLNVNRAAWLMVLHKNTQILQLIKIRYFFIALTP